MEEKLKQILLQELKKKIFFSGPIDKNGYDWIIVKSIHWGTNIVIDQDIKIKFI
jgi:hypothetical protein